MTQAGIAPAALALLLLGACAQNPETIAPTDVPAAEYGGWPCDRLAREEVRLNHAIAALSTEQAARRTTDAVGWIFFLSPTASITARDIRPQIALLKGERQAAGHQFAARCVTAANSTPSRR